MFQFSPAQKEFVREGLRLGRRADSRANNQRRNSTLTCDVLDNLAGSSHLSIDHSKCEIYTGVKLKISSSNEQNPKPEIHLQISSMMKLGKQQLHIMTYIQQLLQLHFLSKEKNNFNSKLVVPNSKRHYIELHIQCFLLTEPHLSLVEHLFVSVKKALLSVSVPKLECIFNEVTNEQTVELTHQSWPLVLGGIDSLMIVGWQQGKGLLDLTPLQFESVRAVFLVLVKGEKVVGVQSLKGAIPSEDIHKICKFALQNRK